MNLVMHFNCKQKNSIVTILKYMFKAEMKKFLLKIQASLIISQEARIKINQIVREIQQQ